MKRKKRILNLLLCVVLVFSFIPVTSHADNVWTGTISAPTQGTGTSSDPYQIGTAEELAWFAQEINSRTFTSTGLDAILTADIVLNDTANLQNWWNQPPARSWTPIGTLGTGSSETFHPYSGTFDGNGHTVSGIYINISGSSEAGLFGCTQFATIINLGIKDSYIKGVCNVGGLAGQANFSTFFNCFSEASVSGSYQTGGLIGNLTGGGPTGTESVISYCYNTGTVTSIEAGGIAGYVLGKARLVRCYNAGMVNGGTGSNTGSLVGSFYNYDGAVGAIYNSYFLTGSAPKGATGGADGFAGTEKTLEEFKNGEVAYLLQGGQVDLYWGHTILDGTEFPQLAVFNSELKEVLRLKFYDDTNLFATAYARKGDSAVLPSDPIRAHYAFEGWNTTQSGIGTEFTASTEVTEDVSLYARWNNFAGGDGSASSPYLVEIPEQLCFMAEAVNNDNENYGAAHYKLNADIALDATWTIHDTTFEAALTSGTAWTPIGTWNMSDTSLRKPFQGTFDGDGHTISNIFINSTDDYQGLFGAINGGTLQNLSVENSYINGNQYVGGLAGYCTGSTSADIGSSTITDCHNEGTVLGTTYSTGGIAGYCYSTQVSKCTNSGLVKGSPTTGINVGGIIGLVAYGSNVSECLNSGTVTGVNEIGGIAGKITYCTNSGTENSYNTGDVSGNNNVGGIAGQVLNGSGSVTNSFHSGSVSGNSGVGGVVGYAGSGITVANSYFLQGTAPAGIGTGTGSAIEKTSEDVKTGEVCYLLQNGQSNLIWGHTTLNGTELPQLAVRNTSTEKVIRVQFYDDSEQEGTFRLVSSDYTLPGGTVTFPSITGSGTLSWIDSSNTIFTSSSAFTADTDLYASWSGDPDPSFVAVTNITGVPQAATAGVELMLSGTVNPTNATNKTIAWSIKDCGSSGATITGNTFYAVSADTVIITATVMNGATESTDYTQDFNVIVRTAPLYTITASAGTGGTISPNGTLTVLEGENLTFTITPDVNHSIYSVCADSVDVGKISSYTFYHITTNHSITAAFTNDSGGSGGGGSSGSSSTSSIPEPKIKVATSGDTAVVTITLTGKPNNAGTVMASLTESLVLEAVQKAVEEAKEDNVNSVILEIKITGPASASGVSLHLSSDFLDFLNDSRVSRLRVSTPAGVISFDADVLNAFKKQGKDVTIGVSKIDSSTLSKEIRATAEGRPIYDFSLRSGNTTISHLGGGTATVSLPYTPASGEDTDQTIIYYDSGNGELVIVPNCLYDAESGTINFMTTHFSTFAVGYNKIDFIDVSGWYEDSVQYLAARGIMKGTANGTDGSPDGGTFSPDSNLTRAQLVTILASLSGEDMSFYTDSVFSDVPTSNWYSKSVRWAYENGIIFGAGGKFNPDVPVSRQDLAVILMRYAKSIGYDLPDPNGEITFNDSNRISSYAADAVAAMQQAGIISGNSDGSFLPTASTTRAQAAKMISLLVQGMIEI